MIDHSVAELETSSESQGRVWRLALVCCAIVVGVQMGFAPLADPDLPSHLSVGESILARRSVPLVEPFAWTRIGAPYYAYSWLPQIVMFGLLRSGGPLALHLLAGVLGAAVVLASAAAARAFGLRPSGSALFGVLAATVALETTPFLRPQMFMHAIVPLAWLCVALSRSERIESWVTCVALVLLNALGASVHISFPVLAAPLVLFVAESPVRLKSVLLASASTLLGWMLSPYGTKWPSVFALNFARNALTSYPPPAGELTPGFIISPWFGVALAALPLVAVVRMRDDRQRLFYGTLWLAGLVAFSRMFKALGPWWWCATPMILVSIARLSRASTAWVRRVFAALLVLATAALAIPNVRIGAATMRYEGGVVRRELPSLKGYATEPAARWLERNMQRGANGRLLTSFIYGSYLKWRVPSLSQSIDGRTIFPDSAALPDAVAERTVIHLGPWRSADVAVVPLTYPVALTLDADASWCRVGVASPAPWDPSAPRAALWVRRAWWATVRMASDSSRCGPVSERR
ncbi:MAG: hypothetical protein ABI601_05185 [bacterium]